MEYLKKNKRICDHFELHSLSVVHENIFMISKGDLGRLQQLRWSYLRRLLTTVINYHKKLLNLYLKHFCFGELDPNKFEANVTLANQFKYQILGFRGHLKYHRYFP